MINRFLINYEKILLPVVFLILILIRIIALNTVPVNITGDEVTNISDVDQLLFSNHIYLFDFMGDGTVAGVIFYYYAAIMRFFSTADAFIALRLATVILSALSLMPFYLMVKKRTNAYFSIMSTLLFGSDYIFLNFSRTGWINMETVFSGLFTLYFLEKTQESKKMIDAVLTGVFGALLFYGYHYGKILLVSIILYTVYYLLKNPSKKALKTSLYFIITVILTISPFIYNIYLDNAKHILQRPTATFAFTDSTSNISTFTSKLKQQTINTINGFVFLSQSTLVTDIEDMRYAPYNTTPVSLPIMIIFPISLLYILIRRKVGIWFNIFITVLIVEIATVAPPNFDRGLLYLPFVYFTISVFTYNSVKYLKKRISIKPLLIPLFSLAVLGISVYNVYFYFSWMKEPSTISVREPALTPQNFASFEMLQRKNIQQKNESITIYDWKALHK